MSSTHETGVLSRDDPADAELASLLGELDDLLVRLEGAESIWLDWLVGVAADYRASARNLLHYWAIRQSDLRELQSRLAAFGLSSLGRSEPHVEATLRLVRSAVVAMLEDTWRPPEPAAVSADEGHELLRPAHRRAAGACAGRQGDPHHGHPAVGSGERSGHDSPPAGAWHERRPDQLRT